MLILGKITSMGHRELVSSGKIGALFSLFVPCETRLPSFLQNFVISATLVTFNVIFH